MRAVNHQHSPTPEEIMEYLDGEGAPATRETIAAHLATCGECQAVAAAQRDISRHAQAWTIGHPPASLTAREGPRASWAVLVAWIRQPRAAALTVSAAAVVLVLMSMTGGSAKRMLTPAKQARPVAAAAEAVQYQPGHQARGEAVGGAVGGFVGRLAGTPPPPRRGDVTASLPAAVPEAVAQVRTPSIIRTATLRLIAKDVSSARAKVESV